MWQLYYGASTISLASYIALLDAGVDVTLHRLDIAQGAHKVGDYAKLNPKLRVPMLITEDGALSETPAILAYIAQSFPDANLAPVDDAFAFAKLQEFHLYVASTLHVAHAHRMRGHRWVDPEDHHAIKAMKAKVPQSVGDAFAYIEENYFKGGPFVMGAAYSTADPYLFTVSRWIEADSVDASGLTKVLAHRQMMLTRPTVEKAMLAEA